MLKSLKSFMKNILPALVLSLMLVSCSKDYLFERDQVTLSQELKAIANADQGVRNHVTLVNIKYKLRDFYTVCDSLYATGTMTKDTKFDFSTIPSEKAQISKFPEKTQKEFYEERRQGYDLMKYVDKSNREKLYQLINKYGYPSFYNRKWIDTTNVRTGITSVLTHYNFDTPKEKKLLQLMIKEYIKGRVEEGEMKNFLWSADGRNGKPYDYVIDIQRWKKIAYSH